MGELSTRGEDREREEDHSPSNIGLTAEKAKTDPDLNQDRNPVTERDKVLTGATTPTEDKVLKGATTLTEDRILRRVTIPTEDKALTGATTPTEDKVLTGVITPTEETVPTEAII